MEELQLTIRSTDGGLLGNDEEVRATLDGLFPGIAWKWTSTGTDRLAAADAAGVALPQAVRRVMESQPSVLCGQVEIGGVTATFNWVREGRFQPSGRRSAGTDRPWKGRCPACAAGPAGRLHQARDG